MLSNAIMRSLNEQITHELEAAYTYLGMAVWLKDVKLPGFAKWMRVQASKEVGHAMKFYNYIERCGMRPTLRPIEAPPTEWTNINELMAQSLKQEQKVTRWISMIMDVALQEKDHATAVFLQWFATEQVEEENTFSEVLDQLDFIHPENTSALLMFDMKMGERFEKEISNGGVNPLYDMNL